MCGPSGPKLDYRNLESFPKFEDRMRLLVLYRMNENGVYNLSVPSCPFWEMSSSKWQIPNTILGDKVARCSIGVVRSVVQVVQNWITGI